MNAQDKELINEKFEGMARLVNAHFTNVHDKFDEVSERLDKQNGNVADLQKKANDYDKFKSAFRYKAIGIIAIAVLLSIVLYEFGLLELLNIVK